MNQGRVRDVLSHHPKLKQTARHLMATIPLSFRLGKEFWTWYAFFEESERWSADKLTAFQMETLRELLEELSKTSNYYRRHFSEINIQQIESMDQFQAQIPTTSRNEFRDNFAEIQSDAIGTQRLEKAQTSGTTGMALQFHHSTKDWAREWAAICHQWKRVGYVPGESRRGTRMDQPAGAYPSRKSRTTSGARPRALK